MPDTLAAYPGMLRASVQLAVAYRGRMVLWFVGGLFPLLLMAVWLTVVDGGGPTAGWDARDFVGYYVAAAVLFQLTSSRITWLWDEDLRRGELAARMLRPVAPLHQYVAYEAGHAVVSMALLAPVLVVAVALVPALDYDADAARLLGVLAAGLVAFGLSLMMAATFALIGFWTVQAGNAYMLWWGLGTFASGWIAPLDLMPDWLARLALVLPFRSTMGFPVELLLGRLDGGEVAYGFAAGLAWLAVFVLAYVPVWQRGVRRFQAVGG